MTDEFVCGICSSFNESDLNKSRVLWTQDEEGICGALLIHCPIKKHLVHLTFCSCEQFLPAKSFFCVPRDERIDTMICVERQQHDLHETCEDCFQGKMVIDMLRGGSRSWGIP